MRSRWGATYTRRLGFLHESTPLVRELPEALLWTSILLVGAVDDSFGTVREMRIFFKF
jgi:hypothetical protein